MISIFCDLRTLFLRTLQVKTFDANLEGCTLSLEWTQGLKTYWIVNQGKIQSSPRILEPDFIVRGTLSQWMETLYNPLHPVHGCHIEGEGGLLLSLKENILKILAAYQLQWAQYPFVRSFVYQMTDLVHNLIPLSPWVNDTEFEALGSVLKNLYLRVDRLQWDLQSLVSVE
jgi:hypothetical protein